MRIDAFVQELQGLVQGNVESLHRARVASRRLRELVSLLGVDRDTSRKFGRRLRRVTRRLGTVRELDVLMLLIEEFQSNRRYSPAALKQVSTAVGRARAAAWKHLTAKLPIAKLDLLANRLRRLADACRADDLTAGRRGVKIETRVWLCALDARLARRATGVRSATQSAGGVYAPARHHDIRIAVKKLRYAAELSTEAGHRRLVADIATLKRAQDQLGRLHDLEVLLAWGREAQASQSPPDLTAWRQLGALVHAVEDECRQLHARYLRDRLALIAIADRLGASKADAAVLGRLAADCST